jgi:hypothetical protein
MPLVVDVATLGQPVGDVERRVAERVGECVADVAVACELLDQPRDRRGAEEAAAQQAEQERRREQRERGDERDLAWLRRHVRRLRRDRHEAEDHDRRAEQEHRLEAAALGRTRRPPPAKQEHGRRDDGDHHQHGLNALNHSRDCLVVGDQDRVARAVLATAGAEDDDRRLQRGRRIRKRGRAALAAPLEPARRKREQQVDEQRGAQRVRHRSDRPQSRDVEELQAAQREAESDHHHQGTRAVVRTPQRRIGADADEAPGQHDPEIRDRATAGRQALEARRRGQDRDADREGRQAGGGGGPAHEGRAYGAQS